MCIKNKAEVFFYLSSGGTGFLIEMYNLDRQNQQFIKCCTRHSQMSKKERKKKPL